MSAEPANNNQTHPYALKITFLLGFVLLFWRMVILQGENTYWKESTHLFVAYIFISIIIFLNRNNLQNLNMDRSFMTIFLILGCLYSFFIPYQLGIFLGLTTIVNCSFLLTGRLKLERFSLFPRKTIVFIVILMMPLFLKLLLLDSFSWPSDKMIVDMLFLANFPLVVYEEVVFRGILWMFLKKLNLGENSIILIQASLFCISHLRYFESDPIVFWFYTPLYGILFGMIVLRSKTIASSIIPHYFYNVLIGLI